MLTSVVKLVVRQRRPYERVGIAKIRIKQTAAVYLPLSVHLGDILLSIRKDLTPILTGDSDGYEPRVGVVDAARALGARLVLTRDPREAAAGARVVTTDVWASMGQEAEAKAREAAFGAAYQVDDAMMSRAAEDAIFLHCLPAHRGEEVSASVIDGARSRVWDEAENRLHAQKAVLEWLMGGRAPA